LSKTFSASAPAHEEFEVKKIDCPLHLYYSANKAKDSMFSGYIENFLDQEDDDEPSNNSSEQDTHSFQTDHDLMTGALRK